MDQLKPAARKRVSRAGGQARAEALTPEERSAISRAGAAASRRPTALARQLVKLCAEASPAERAEVLDILAEIRP